MSTAPPDLRHTLTTQIVRRRLLPDTGEVLVSVGARVEADEIVARATQVGRTHSVDLARELRVSAQSLDRHLRVTRDDHVTAGQTLASRRRWWQTFSATAPVSGTVRGIEEGCLFLREDPVVLDLRAYLPGEVVEVLPERGVVIRAAGTLIRGALGVGPHSHGVLRAVVDKPEDTVGWDRISTAYRGMILIGGLVDDPRVLEHARRSGVAGLVVGGLVPRLLAVAHEQKLPLVVTEGTGAIPMARPIFETLRAFEGRLAVLSGQGDDHISPELVVPLPDESPNSALVAIQPIRPGSYVRLTRAPYLGLIAQVVALPVAPQKGPLGTWVAGAETRLPNGRIVFVPYANMELLV